MPFHCDDQSAFIAQRVMQRVSENHLRPNPAVYVVLFYHYAHLHPEICQAIAEVEGKGASLTTSYCEELFGRYFAHEFQPICQDMHMPHHETKVLI